MRGERDEAARANVAQLDRVARHDGPPAPLGNLALIVGGLGGGAVAEPAGGGISAGGRWRVHQRAEDEPLLAPRRVLKHWKQLEEGALIVWRRAAGVDRLTSPQTRVAVAVGFEVAGRFGFALEGDHVAIGEGGRAEHWVWW